MESSDITAEIRMAVLGEWVPPQLADVLALQRAEEPETHAVLAGWIDPVQGAELPGDGFDFALSAVARQWPGWVCEPLWHDTLAVAVAKRSHLLAYREVPCGEVLKQRIGSGPEAPQVIPTLCVAIEAFTKATATAEF